MYITKQSHRQENSLPLSPYEHRQPNKNLSQKLRAIKFNKLGNFSKPIKAPVRQVRELGEMNSPPKERDGRGDCKKLEEMVEKVGEKRFI